MLSTYMVDENNIINLSNLVLSISSSPPPRNFLKILSFLWKFWLGAGVMAQVGQDLPSKYEALSSNHDTAKTTKVVAHACDPSSEGGHRQKGCDPCQPQKNR
jgi:hypothetical protein